MIVTEKKQSPNPLLEGVSEFLKITTWLAVGFVFLFLGVICKIKRPVPVSWEPFFTNYIPHLPYFICGFGFLCLAHARSLLRKEYAVEQKKDVNYPHAWKVPLLGTQVFLLYATGIYSILFGLNWFVPPLGMLGLVFFITCFLFYVLWYQVEYFKNRFPALASVRIAAMSFVFAGISFCLWSFHQMIVPSLIMAFLGIFAGFFSLGYSGTTEQKWGWLKYIFVIGTVTLLGIIGYYVLDFWQPQTAPLNTVVVAKGLRGDISNLVYSPKGDKIVFTQKLNNQWFLKVIGSENKSPITVKLTDVDGSFHSVFVEQGKSLLIDAPKDVQRGLLKVDVATGKVATLIKSDVEPFSGGSPWLSSTNQFLFVTKSKKGYDLKSWTSGKANTVVLYSSPTVILSPSWINSGEVVYVDGIHSTPYVLNIKSKTTTPLISEDDKKEQGELVENDPLFEVIPSPDNFRYLCVARKDGTTTLWTALINGTKREEAYKAREQLNDIAWLADSQNIVFERNGLQRGFKHNIKGIMVLDANLRTSEDLMLPQINSHSPAGSPDGIKLAFVGSEGLWYPSLDSGIWVDVLR
jgi:hypothetical protein